jgi:hypothetical protein
MGPHTPIKSSSKLSGQDKTLDEADRPKRIQKVTHFTGWVIVSTMYTSLSGFCFLVISRPGEPGGKTFPSMPVLVVG